MQVNEDSIDTLPFNEKEDDDDVVIQKQEDGSCLIVDQEKMRSTESRRQHLDSLVIDVGKIINKRWQPYTTAFIEAMFEEDGNFIIPIRRPEPRR